MLLFAKEPLRCNIRVGRFKDDITIIDDRQITDTLFEASFQTLKFVKTYLQVAYEFDGNIRRKEKWNYPLQAIKEAVLNAIVHRDYTDPSDIQIKIYDKKITIFSPGKLYGDLTLEQLKNRNYQSSLRNKLIAEAFYLTGEIEKYGTGFLRIEKELKFYPDMQFEFNETANGMLAVFEILEAKSSVKIIEVIKQNNNITIRDLSMYLNISTRAVEKNIAKLKEQGILRRIGPAKGGFWVILKK